MKKLLILLLSVALIAGVLGGCADTGQSGLKDSGGNQYYFYYTNQEETKLQRESYVPEKESPQDMIDELEQKLIHPCLFILIVDIPVWEVPGKFWYGLELYEAFFRFRGFPV